MSSNMKDFAAFNSAMSDLTTSARAQVILKLLQASNDLMAAVKDLPTNYARAYSGVITQEYDSSNHVIDVTDVKPRTTVDYLIHQARNSFIEAKQVLESLEKQVTDISIPVSMTAIDQSIEKTGKHLLFITGVVVNNRDIVFDINSGELWNTAHGAIDSSQLIPNNYRDSTYVNISTNVRLCNESFIKNGKLESVSILIDGSAAPTAKVSMTSSIGWQISEATFNSMTQAQSVTPSGLALSGTITSSQDYFGLADPTAMLNALDGLVS